LLTIAANITGKVSPTDIHYAYKQIVIAFLFQIIISGFFAYDYGSSDDLVPFKTFTTALALVYIMLLYLNLSHKIRAVINFLTFLKRVKSNHKMS
jgi:hypothetical protein